MASDVDRNVNMLFKVAFLGLKSVTSLEAVAYHTLEYMNRDPDAKILKKHIDKGGNLSFSVCQPEYEQELDRRMKQEGIIHFKSSTATLGGNKIFMFAEKDAKAVEQILSEMRLEHGKGGLLDKQMMNDLSEGSLKKITGLNKYEATMFCDMAKGNGINVALENPDTGTYNLVYRMEDQNKINNMKMTIAIQEADPLVYSGIRKQLDFEEKKMLGLMDEAEKYQSNKPYYLIDLDGNIACIKEEKVTFWEPGGQQIVINSDDLDRNETVRSMIGTMNNPAKFRQEEMEWYNNLTPQSKVNAVIGRDKESGRPDLTNEEIEAMRKMQDARELYEAKLAMDNPDLELYSYSYLNNEMKMAEFVEYEKINAEFVHDKTESMEQEVPVIYDDARSLFRGFHEEKEELDQKIEELGDAIMDDRDIDELMDEFEKDDKWSDLYHDENANYIWDEFEDPYDNMEV